MFTRGFTASGNRAQSPVNPLADQNLTGTWTDSSVIFVKYQNASSEDKLALIITNDAWANYTKFEQLDRPSGMYGGPRSSKTHWFVKGYSGPYYVLKMSDTTLANSGSASDPPENLFAYEHNSDSVITQSWSTDLGWATHADAITATNSEWADATIPDYSSAYRYGYSHGVNAMNGFVIAARGHPNGGSHALISTNYGRAYSLSYASPGTYSFGGYTIACPGWTGATDGALFWHFGVDNDGAGGSSGKTNKVLMTEDGSSWTTLGNQANGMGAPSYNGQTKIINIPGTDRLYWRYGGTLYRSTNGYQFFITNTNGGNLYNVSVTSTNHLIGVGYSSNTVTIYKSSDTEDQIDSSTTWASVNSFTVSDAASTQQVSLSAPYPN